MDAGRALPGRGGVRHERRDPVADPRHALRREDRRHVPRRARDGVPGVRRHEHLRPALGPGLRPAPRRRDPRRRRGHRRATGGSCERSADPAAGRRRRQLLARAGRGRHRADPGAGDGRGADRRARPGGDPRRRRSHACGPRCRGRTRPTCSRASDEQLDHLPPWALEEMGSIDASISVHAAWNTRELTAIDPAKIARRSRAAQPLMAQFMQRSASGRAALVRNGGPV